LVAEEVAPVLENLAWLKKVWSLPRTRGRARWREAWPVIRTLRRERFDRSVDFAGNDRGAIVSFLIGARERLGPQEGGGFFGRKKCYTKTLPAELLPESWVQRNLQILSAWQIPPPESTRLEIAADPALTAEAANLLPENRIFCHLAASQPKKEWPLRHWAEFHRLAAAAGLTTAFSSGINERERALLAELKKIAPEICALPPVSDLKLFLAVLRRARAMISGDTGPLHFAAGLNVPVIGLFATGDSLRRAAPIYPPEQILAAADCACDRRLLNLAVCPDELPCMASILPEEVLHRLQKNAAANPAGR
jgi:ADP-heptose:LPS heptosyltransferase